MGSIASAINGLAIIGAALSFVVVMGGGVGAALLSAVLVGAGIWLYLLPAWLASSRGHLNAGAILALNVLLGWLLIPWVGALVWALTKSAYLESQRTEAARRDGYR